MRDWSDHTRDHERDHSSDPDSLQWWRDHVWSVMAKLSKHIHLGKIEKQNPKYLLTLME